MKMKVYLASRSFCCRTGCGEAEKGPQAPVTEVPSISHTTYDKITKKELQERDAGSEARACEGGGVD